MSQPSSPLASRGPNRPPAARPFRSGRWLRGLVAMVCLAAVAAAGSIAGYQLGEAKRVVPVWDPLWMRSYLERPLDTAGPSPGFWVAGYYVSYDRSSLQTLTVRSPHLDQVVAFSYGIGLDGAIQGEDPRHLLGVVGGSKLVLLFANMHDGKFSRQVVEQLLGSPEIQQEAIQGILAKVETMSAAGAQIDFEDVPSAGGPKLVGFLRDLQAALSTRNKSLSIAVPARTSDLNNGWNDAFNYGQLAQVVDYLYVMAYDQHWQGGPPGPVAALPWTESVVRYAVFRVPAGKLVLGIPGYGYDWGPGGGQAFGSQRMGERLRDQGADVNWDPVLQENVATYRSAEGNQVAWYPDQRSLEAKLRLARQYNLRGVALWRLGLEPESYWAALGAERVASR